MATHQVVGKAAQHSLETLDDCRFAVLALAGLLVELERTRQHKEHTADALTQVQLNPRRKLLTQPRRGNASCPDTTALARGLKLRCTQFVDALARNRFVVPTKLEESRANVATEEVVGAECVDAHVPTHGHKLRTGEVVERQVVVKQTRDVDDILRGGGLAGGPNFAEELFERFRAHDMRVCLQSGFTKGLLEELGHLQADTKQLPLFLLLYTV